MSSFVDFVIGTSSQLCRDVQVSWSKPEGYVAVLCTLIPSSSRSFRKLPTSNSSCLNFCAHQLLEKQLKKAAAEERKMGIDLSGLRAQIKKEIADVDRRL